MKGLHIHEDRLPKRRSKEYQKTRNANNSQSPPREKTPQKRSKTPSFRAPEPVFHTDGLTSAHEATAAEHRERTRRLRRPLAWLGPQGPDGQAEVESSWESLKHMQPALVGRPLISCKPVWCFGIRNVWSSVVLFFSPSLLVNCELINSTYSGEGLVEEVLIGLNSRWWNLIGEFRRRVELQMLRWDWFLRKDRYLLTESGCKQPRRSV